MPTDLREALRDAAAAPQTPFHVEAAYRAGRRRRRGKTALAGVVALALGVAAVQAILPRLRTPDVIFDPAPVTGWQTMPTSLLEPRYDHVAEWTGEEVLVWGGIDDDQYF